MSNHIIRISENALINLCLNGIEAYSVPHKAFRRQKNRLEIYGTLWGYEVTQPGKTLYSVELVSIDTSAKQDHDSVDPSNHSLELKKELITSFWPHYGFLGDVHTHPYEHYKDVIAIKGYNFSSDDISRIEDNSLYWLTYGYRVGLVLTIARLQRKTNRGIQRIDPSTIEFTLAKYRLCLKGYVATFEEDGLKLSTGEQKVLLDCPALHGLVREYTGFNELEIERNKRASKNKTDRRWAYIGEILSNY